MLVELARFVRHVASHPSPLPNRVGALGRFAYRQLRKRLTAAPLVVAWEGFRLEVPHDAHFAAAAYYLRRPDFWELAFLERYLRPGDVAFDVGANVGVYTLFLAKCVGPGGRVIACEPDAVNLARLRSNLALNALPQVTVIPEAVGDAPGVARFVTGLGTMGRLASVAPGAAHVEVPMTTLDALAAAHRPVFVKIDVEGAEPLVLAGAQATLAAGAPAVFLLELGGGARQTAERLLAAGYSFHRFDPATGRLSPADWQAPGGNNLLAVRDPSAVDARLAASRA